MMDSFYEAPRRPPIPTVLNKVPPVASVPEISIISPAIRNDNKISSSLKPDKPIFNNFPYNNNNAVLQIRQSSTEPPSTAGNPRKQVRFEPPINPIRNNFPSVDEDDLKENIPHDFKGGYNLNGKTFKQIYMANIPNRHLDLSIIDPPPTKQPSKEPNQDDSLEFCGLDSNHSPIYKTTSYLKSINKDFTSDRIEKPTERIPPKPTWNNALHKNVENANLPRERYDQLEKWSKEESKSDEPTFKDLVEIIKQQNEQIMLLQKQMTNLQSHLENSNKNKMIEGPPTNSEEIHRSSSSPRRALPKKFSIDLKTTSFEVSFRPQQKFRKPHTDYHEPKIQEIVETESSQPSRVNEELSLKLPDSIDIREDCPSPTPSININMDSMEDYESSNYDESESGGATFYQDIMYQVNNMLQNVQLHNGNGNPPYNRNQFPFMGQTSTEPNLNDAKEATLNYLKNIGINLNHQPNEHDAKGSNGYSPSEVSFAVKQLLLKYLPDDQLAKIIGKQAPINTMEKSCVNTAPPAEFSFATVQYMKKYNLLSKKQPLIKEKRALTKPNDNKQKILNISSLKLQPKLL